MAATFSRTPTERIDMLLEGKNAVTGSRSTDVA